MKRPPYVSSFEDRHGKRRYRFRRKGYAVHYFKEPFGTKAFEREYARCLNEEPAQAGADRTAPGSVADVITRYYEDATFLDLRASTQVVYRAVLERFRNDFGRDPMGDLDANLIASLMTGMRSKPHAAARLRKPLAQLFVLARRAKIVPYDFDPIRSATRARRRRRRRAITAGQKTSWRRSRASTRWAPSPASRSRCCSTARSGAGTCAA